MEEKKPTIEEQVKANAQFAKQMYDAYVEVGFSNSQAIKLLMANLSR